MNGRTMSGSSRSPPESSYAVSYGRDLVLGHGTSRPSRLPRGSSTSADMIHSRRRGKTSSAPDAFSSASEAWASQPILSPEVLAVLSSTLSSAGKAPHGARRPPPSMWDSPEYAAWQRDCEKLYAEHQAQKLKNKRAESGDGA